MIQPTIADQQHLHDLGVVALYLFGSRAQGIAGPGSDYDFAVLLREANAADDSKRYPKIHDAIYDICSDLVQSDDAPPPPVGHFTNIDVVFLQRDRTPLHYPMHVMKHGVLLYDGDSKQRLQFEEHARYLTMDFQPIRHAAERAALAML